MRRRKPPVDADQLVLVVPPPGPTPRQRQLRLRVMLLALSVCLWALVVGARLVQLQVHGHEAFERLARRQSERTITLDPRRGPILDRNGRHLAVSVDADSIYAVPSEVEDPIETAAIVARELQLETSERKQLEHTLRKDRAFVWVRRKVDPRASRSLRELGLPGIGFLTENRRYYPKRELAAHVLGYVGLDNQGMSGVEYEHDNRIRGREAKVLVRTDARRRPVGHTDKPSTEGHAVVLTIDETLQHIAEDELDRAVRATRSIAGFVVIMDPRTGEILAMANRPTFNPNRFADYPSSRWKNRAVVDAFEPGSIFKIITAAAGIQEGVVTPGEIIDCGNGYIEIAETRINDHAVFDQLAFRDVIARSSDIGVIRVAQRLGRDQMHRYIRAFGFGDRTGLGLPGESAGLLRPPAKWSALSLASLSFGQEIGVTAVQMTAAAAAVANGGYLMQPHVVRQIEDIDGHVVEAAEPRVLARILEPDTVDTLTKMLERVVTDGTGRKAALSGYTVAGKTGTAQKVDASGRYSMIDHVASFVGFVPSSRPALVILTSLDEPRGEFNQGGDVAAPLFARIAEKALRHLAVPPELPDRVLRAMAWPRDPAIPVAFASAEAAPGSLAPTPNWDESALDLGEGPLLMPDLVGRSAREAAIAAARRGLTVELRGSGSVLSQTPVPGTELEAGMACVLELGPARLIAAREAAAAALRAETEVAARRAEAAAQAEAPTREPVPPALPPDAAEAPDPLAAPATTETGA